MSKRGYVITDAETVSYR